MITPAEYPILEFDASRLALTEPNLLIKPRDVPEHCVICFFKDALEQVAREQQVKQIVENRWEDGPHPLYEMDYQGYRVAFFHPGVGAPIAAGLLEEVIALGCRKFIVCGGCGVLDKAIAVGQLIVVNAAVRDEGVSYHYLPPGREVHANPIGVSVLEQVLNRNGIPHLVGKTWTTDAPYRETATKIAARRAEGCLAVEMEAAALMAVAEFRHVTLGQVVYGGDDLSGDLWDNRRWQSRQDVRLNLFWLAVETCLDL